MKETEVFWPETKTSLSCDALVLCLETADVGVSGSVSVCHKSCKRNQGTVCEC